MTWAMIGAAAVTTVGNAALRPPQLAGQAPAPNNGGSAPGLLGQAPETPSAIEQSPQIDILSLINSLPPPKDTPQVKANDQPVTSMPSVFNTDAQNASMTQDTEGGGFGKALGGFMGGMDKTLQSPIKRLGLGLLDQQDPRLALGALLASGLFGGKGG